MHGEPISKHNPNEVPIHCSDKDDCFPLQRKLTLMDSITWHERRTPTHTDKNRCGRHCNGNNENCTETHSSHVQTMSIWRNTSSFCQRETYIIKNNLFLIPLTIEWHLKNTAAEKSYTLNSSFFQLTEALQGVHIYDILVPTKPQDIPLYSKPDDFCNCVQEKHLWKRLTYFNMFLQSLGEI